MSCNYADGLSPYLHKGKLGLPEIPDQPDAVLEKIRILADWILASKHTVVHTGAGCSTSAGIPDFRGPKGVWTLENVGQKPDINIPFDSATPTPAHLILNALLNKGYVKYIVTQNIDGLHLRSGVERSQISELHGNMFVAKCSYCKKYIAVQKSLPTVGQKEIGLDCPVLKPGGRRCRGKLHDTLLDWEDSLPDQELETAEIHSRLADLSICLGTTLQIIPAGNLPLFAKKNPGGRFVIVNLQETKHDKKADLIIRAKIDFVMAELSRLLKTEVPTFSLDMDPTQNLPEKTEKYIDWTIPRSAVNRLNKLLADRNPSKRKTTSSSENA